MPQPSGPRWRSPCTTAVVVQERYRPGQRTAAHCALPWNAAVNKARNRVANNEVRDPRPAPAGTRHIVKTQPAQAASHMAQGAPPAAGSVSFNHGTPGCRCKADPPQLHGPYWQWTRKVAGKTVTLPPPQSAVLDLADVAVFSRDAIPRFMARKLHANVWWARRCASTLQPVSRFDGWSRGQQHIARCVGCIRGDRMALSVDDILG